jgi:hypothetical protein
VFGTFGGARQHLVLGSLRHRQESSCSSRAGPTLSSRLVRGQCRAPLLMPRCPR